MNILIIDDDDMKVVSLADVLSDLIEGGQLFVGRSYIAGLRLALENQYDLVLMDVSIPNYDITGFDTSGETRVYGGLELIAELNRIGRLSKFVVVTQFDEFGEGRNYKTLTQLVSMLEICYPTEYLGTVFFGASDEDWRIRLLQLTHSIRMAHTSEEGT